MKKLLSLIVLNLIIGFSYASDSIELGLPAYGGNGCPQGSSDIFISPDQSEMFIRFNNYSAEAGGGLATLARKSCNLAIPLHLPGGISVSLVGVHYLGSVELPRKASATFNTEYFFVGQKSVKSTKEFTGKLVSDFHIEDEVAIESQTWSACGADTILRINSSMLVKANKRATRAVASVDGMALDAGIVFKIKTRSCLK